MINNDVVRSVRYMLNVYDETLVSIIRLGGGDATIDDVRAYLERDDAPGFRACPDRVMGAFLDGLILHRRGAAETTSPRPIERVITNNTVLKKLRVAFELREEHLVAIMAAAGFQVSRPELSALFRNPAHHNYRACGDQFLRNFLKSLTARLRDTPTA